MAKVQIKLPDDFEKKLSRLGDRTDEILPKVLEAGGKVVLGKVKSNLQSVVGKNTKYPSESTGELIASLGISPAKRDRKENYNVKVGFAEPRRKQGDSNAKIANILEYGRPGQPPRPFLKPARSSSRKECIETMKQALEKEMKL